MWQAGGDSDDVVPEMAAPRSGQLFTVPDGVVEGHDDVEDHARLQRPSLRLPIFARKSRHIFLSNQAIATNTNDIGQERTLQDSGERQHAREKQRTVT